MYHVNNHYTTALRPFSPTNTVERPELSKLIPKRRPTAHAAVLGHPMHSNTPTTSASIPLTTGHHQFAASMSVSVVSPSAGFTTSTTPLMMSNAPRNTDSASPVTSGKTPASTPRIETTTMPTPTRYRHVSASVVASVPASISGR